MIAKSMKQNVWTCYISKESKPIKQNRFFVPLLIGTHIPIYIFYFSISALRKHKSWDKRIKLSAHTER